MSEKLKNDLKEEIDSKDVIFICGTGISLSATEGKPEMGWGGLLLNGLTYAIETFGNIDAEQFERFKGMLKRNDLVELISVAEMVEQKLGGCTSGEFRRWLKETFDPEVVEIKDFTVLNMLKQLAENGCILATTNYDSLLEVNTGYKPVTYLDNIDKVIEIINGKSKGILHLQGYWDEPKSVVLGWRGYEKVKTDERAELIRQVLRTTKTIIFVGSGGGLDDPNIGHFLKWAAGPFAESKSRIYVIVREKEVKEIRRNFSHEDRVIPVIYGKSYKDLGPFLQSLLPDNITNAPVTIKTGTGFDTGLIAIHISIGDECIFENLNDARSIDIMSNTAKDLIKRYSNKIIDAIATHECRVRILVSNPENDFWGDEAVCNGLCPGINIQTEIADVVNILKYKVNTQKQNKHLQIGGSLEVKTYSNVPTCSIIIIDNKIARFTPYLPFAHSTEVPIYDVINEGRAELFTQLQKTYERVWKSKYSKTIFKENFLIKENYSQGR